jgi:beta-lactamase regulating signal transducer with metallopeptidase domain
MTAELILLFLFRMNLAASGAVLAVLLIRPHARRLLGAELAYGLWLLVPVAALTSLFPNLRDLHAGPYRASFAFFPSEASVLLTFYAIGAAAMLAVFALSEWRFRNLARRGAVGPAVMGLGWPVMVVPSDYHARFNEAERELIRLHERTHMLRQHPRDHRWIAAHQLLGWFNPLIHLAARCARLDQELACDAAVIEARPKSRRGYAETLLKGAKAPGPWSAFACALTEGGRHPLEVRIGCLSRRPPSLRQFMFGAAVVGHLAVAAAVGVWSLSPGNFGSGQTYRNLPFGAVRVTPVHVSAPDG